MIKKRITKDKERIIILEAIYSARGDFNSVPIKEFNDSEYQFQKESLELVKQANCKLKWIDTFAGGCWYIVPLIKTHR